MGGFFAISLGGNLKNTRRAFDRALRALHSNRNITLTGSSRTVRTDPWEVTSPAFFNKVVRGYARIGSPGLWGLLVRTERKERRRGKGKLYPRTLDLDFLCFEGPSSPRTDLVLPHPRLILRPVLLELLREARRCRRVFDPVHGKSRTDRVATFPPGRVLAPPAPGRGNTRSFH